MRLIFVESDRKQSLQHYPPSNVFYVRYIIFCLQTSPCHPFTSNLSSALTPPSYRLPSCPSVFPSHALSVCYFPVYFIDFVLCCWRTNFSFGVCKCCVPVPSCPFKVMTWMVPCEWLKTMKPTHKLLFILCPMLVLCFIYYSSGKLHLHVWGQKPRKWHLQSNCNISSSPDHPSVIVLFETYTFFQLFLLSKFVWLCFAASLCWLPVSRPSISMLFVFKKCFISLFAEPVVCQAACWRLKTCLSLILY